MALSRTVKVSIVLSFSITLFLLEVIVGYVVGSIALIADSFHMLNDILGFVVALGAMRLAKSSTFGPRYTYGWKRAEVLGALINAVLLLGLCLTIYIEAIQRFFNPTPIESPLWILGVGCAGFLFNVVGMFLFQDAHVHGAGGCGGGHSHSQVVPPSPAGATEALGHGHAHRHETCPSADSQTRLRNDEDTLEGESSSDEVDGTPELRQTIISVLPPNDRYTLNHPGRFQESIIDAAANLSASFRERSYPRLASATGSDRRPSASYDAVGPHTPLLHGSGTSRTHVSIPSYHATSAGTPEDGTVVATTPTSRLPDPAVYSELTGGASLERASTARGHSHSHEHSGKDHDHGHGGRLNMRAVFLHVLGDALANLAVIASALIIWLSDSPYRFYFDPAISLVINTVIVYFTLPLVKSASYILLQSVPESVSIGSLRSEIRGLPHVLSIHELHVWQLSDTQIIGSVHVFVSRSLGETGFMQLAIAIKAIMHRHGIHSTTIQPEFVPNPEHVENNIEAAETACLLRCAEFCTTPSCCFISDQNTRLIDSGSPSDDDDTASRGSGLDHRRHDHHSPDHEH
ncbi:Zinc resistance conferring protein [Tieghemiomyces parasiticus]|uniref:Zinc resistance conferring protein n=1 Tax=Tieghemiomyces parasiticus TaxID=78921 RepID=A0A9W8DP16_9FUNG|nr:Zinc resistance conferring protein [Tieghemiomyces parasiticus]